MFTANEREIMGLYGKYEVKNKNKVLSKLFWFLITPLLTKKLLLLLLVKYIYFLIPLYLYIFTFKLFTLLSYVSYKLRVVYRRTTLFGLMESLSLCREAFSETTQRLKSIQATMVKLLEWQYTIQIYRDTKEVPTSDTYMYK